MGELVGAAREGLLALSVGVGLGVLAELMEEEVVEVVGPKDKQDPNRVAVRHGHEAGEVTLGGRRVPVERPRVRSADGRSELPLQTYAHFADRDPLTKVVLERPDAGAGRGRGRAGRPVNEQVVGVAGVRGAHPRGARRAECAALPASAPERKTAPWPRASSPSDKQDPLLEVEAALNQIREQRGRDGRVLGRAFPQPERDLDAVGGDPERDDVGAPFQLDPA